MLLSDGKKSKNKQRNITPNDQTSASADSKLALCDLRAVSSGKVPLFFKTEFSK